MEPCKRCGQLRESGWTCPHCGYTQWENIIFHGVLSLICLGVAVFTSDCIRWGAAAVGLLFLVVAIREVVTALKTPKTYKKDNALKETAQAPKPIVAPSSGDSYVETCFHIEFQENKEDRNPSEIPEAKAVIETGAGGPNPGDKVIEEALRLVAVVRDKYPDFYFSYLWFAALYCKQKRYDDARNSLSEGLRFAKSKYKLCNMMGDTEWELGNLSEAVMWWTRSVIIQVGTKQLGEYSPFLNLSYVAKQLGLDNTCALLRQYVDKIEYGGIRLTGNAVNELYAATRRHGTESMKQVMDTLDRKYLLVEATSVGISVPSPEAQQHLKSAYRLQAEGKLQEAYDECEKACQSCPKWQEAVTLKTTLIGINSWLNLVWDEE